MDFWNWKADLSVQREAARASGPDWTAQEAIELIQSCEIFFQLNYNTLEMSFQQLLLNNSV